MMKKLFMRKLVGKDKRYLNDMHIFLVISLKIFLDLDMLKETRKNLPYLTQKRSDLYEIKELQLFN